MLLFLLKAFFCHYYPLLYFLKAVLVATDITQVFEAAHLFNRFIFNLHVNFLCFLPITMIFVLFIFIFIPLSSHLPFSFISMFFNIYFEDLMKNCFLNTGGVNIGGRRIKCIRFADDMALIAEDERMLKNMLMELNDRYEDYGMKININKTKIMVIGRKQRK